MEAVPPSATGEPLHRFTTLCDDAFKGPLGHYGFTPIRGMRRQHKFLASRVYRAGELYIRVSAVTHPRDAPSRAALLVGEGSHEFPEADWNSIALWQLGRAQITAEPYLLEDVRQLPLLLRQMRTDLERTAPDFLSGDLGRFRLVRSALARSRSPYTIWRSTQPGHYSPVEDPVSGALRRRYAADAGGATEKTAPGEEGEPG